MSDYADSMGQVMGQGIDKIFRTMDMDFNEFWEAYKPNEFRFPRRRAATFLAWNRRTPAARRAMLAKVKAEGAPEWKNPYFYVVDFPEPEPEFLKGNEGGDLVQVRYNGAYKICTRETMNDFNLEEKMKE